MPGPLHEAVSCAERVEACRAWLAEFVGDVGDDGRIRLACLDADGWSELNPGFRPSHGPYLDVDDRERMLDSLAASIITLTSSDANVFASPYLHPGPREKGGATARRHVHADIDKGPYDADRAYALGAIVVASGGVTAEGPHAHIYVRLSESVTPSEHEALCRALGEFVGGKFHDKSKVSDEDVLRPPGTLNFKYDPPRPVRWLVRPDDESVRTWSPDDLARLLGVAWPPRADDRAERPLSSAPPARSASAPYNGNGLDRRLDGLARTVTLAPEGEGNKTLNWAAGKAGALLRGATDDDQHDARERLVAAFLGRPIPPRESVPKREREARATVQSGWAWGSSDPDTALHENRDEFEIANTEGKSADGSRDDEAVTVTEADETAHSVGYDDFWTARPFLTAVRDFARARRIGPWALLGDVLGIAAASVPPSVMLPPTRGSVASLNLFVGICGESGSGKSATYAAAREFLRVDGGCDYLETSPGSGEGLLAAYVFTRKEKGKPPRIIQTRAAVLLSVDEIDGLGALTSRTASTLLPFLKTAWSGGTLGTQNADLDRLRRVDAHAYRLAIVAGIQPANASVVLDDERGGFPQRWLWMPTYDPGRAAPDEHVPEPEPWAWRVPVESAPIDDDGALVLPWGRTVMELPATAVAAILTAAETHNHPIGATAMSDERAGGLDGHALLTRAKVAALLALLDERADVVTAEDWHLAGVVMQVSDDTRAQIMAVNKSEAAKAADRKAARSGRSAAIAADATSEARTVTATRKLLDLLGDGREHSKGECRDKLRRYRDEFDDALDRLAGTGQVARDERENAKGRLVEYLRLNKGAGR